MNKFCMVGENVLDEGAVCKQMEQKDKRALERTVMHQDCCCCCWCGLSEGVIFFAADSSHQT